MTLPLIMVSLIFNRPETEKDFEKGKEYEYVAAGIGREEDFANIDVRGKLADSTW